MNAWTVAVAWTLAASAVGLRDRRRLVRSARARHEIRGPLSAARLALEGLDRSARVQAAELELRRAALALDDLARAGRGGRAGDDVRRVDAGRLLREAAHAWRPLATAAGTTLVLKLPGGPLPVEADRLRLTQACANLVTNAIEHGAGPVRVRASLAGGRVRIEVVDDGPGLPAPLPVLLTAARGRRTARGHGLAIAAAIAERHGGRLGALPGPPGHLVLDLPLAGTPRRATSRRRPGSRSS